MLPLSTASKFALEGYSESLRHELRDFGIWVSPVEPGWVRTGLGDASSTRRPRFRPTTACAGPP